MERRVVITGIGVICNLGDNRFQVMKALGDDVIGLERTKEIEVFNHIEPKRIGKTSIPIKDVETYDELDRIEIFSRKSLNEALSQSKLTIEDLENLKERVAMSFATSVGGIYYIMEYLKEGKKDAMWLVNYHAFISRLMSEYRIKGPNYVTSSACAAGTAGAGIGFDLIKNNEADIVLVGGTDTITDLSLVGFNCLKTLSQDVCKPFNEERDGINIGEASAFFIFEEYEHAKKRNAPLIAEIGGYGISNDAYHSTSPDPNGGGAYRAMEMALKNAGIESKDIDYINAHGTGTLANDNMEVKAIKDLFKHQVIVTSTKSRTGHCLGAAGSIELAFCIEAINSNRVPRTLNSNNDLLKKNDILGEIPEGKIINYALSNSFAFGGNTASIVVKAINC